MASEQEKLLLMAFHVSVAAHRFQNDGVKKGWEAREIRDVRQQGFLGEARWHKQCAERERVCIVVVVVLVFGWGANEWNEEDDECHRWPRHNEEFLFEQLMTMRQMSCQDSSLMCDLEHHKSNISEQEALDIRLFRWDRAGP